MDINVSETRCIDNAPHDWECKRLLRYLEEAKEIHGKFLRSRPIDPETYGWDFGSFEEQKRQFWEQFFREESERLRQYRLRMRNNWRNIFQSIVSQFLIGTVDPKPIIVDVKGE